MNVVREARTELDIDLFTTLREHRTPEYIHVKLYDLCATLKPYDYSTSTGGTSTRVIRKTSSTCLLFSRHHFAFSPPFVSPPALSVAEPPFPYSQTPASPPPSPEASAPDIHELSSLSPPGRKASSLCRRCLPLARPVETSRASSAAVSGHLPKSRCPQRRLEVPDRGLCEACQR